MQPIGAVLVERCSAVAPGPSEVGPSLAGATMGMMIAVALAFVAADAGALPSLAAGAIGGGLGWFVPRAVARLSHLSRTWTVGTLGYVEQAKGARTAWLYAEHWLFHWTEVTRLANVPGDPGTRSAFTFLVPKREGERATLVPKDIAEDVRGAYEQRRADELRNEASPSYVCLKRLDAVSAPVRGGEIVVHPDALEFVSGVKRARIPWRDLEVRVLNGVLMAAWPGDALRVPLGLVADSTLLLKQLQERGME